MQIGSIGDAQPGLTIESGGLDVFDRTRLHEGGLNIGLGGATISNGGLRIEEDGLFI